MVDDILVIDGKPETWKQAIESTYYVLHEHGYVRESFLSACIQREKDYPTGLPTEIGVSIPHTDAEHVLVSSICVLRLEKPVLFQAMGDSETQIKVYFVFNVALKDNNGQLSLLQSVIRLAKDSKYLLSCKEKTLHQIRNELMEIWCNGKN